MDTNSNDTTRDAAKAGWRSFLRLRVLPALLCTGALWVAATSGGSADTAEVLVARSIRLVDAEGALRGTLTTDDRGRVVLSVVGPSGGASTSLLLADSEPRFAVVDARKEAAGAAAVGPPADTAPPESDATEKAAEAPDAEPGKQGMFRWGGAPEDDDEAFDWAD